MNEKEAREIVGDKHLLFEKMSEKSVDRCLGYLECFEQVKPLVNLIVSIQTWAKVHEKVEIRRLCDETLSNFRKVQEEKP